MPYIDPSILSAAAVVLALTVFLLTLVSTDGALILLIFSMLLSPEFSLGAVGRRAIVVRADDIMLFVIFFTWLAKLAINKQFGVLRYTPLNVPLFAFIVSCIVSTAWGIISGAVSRPMAAFFYVLKYIEYFLLYFMVSNVIRSEAQIRRFVGCMLATAVLVGLYAYWQFLGFGVGYRLTAPFERVAEPNTLAAYLLIIMSVIIGLAVHARSGVKAIGYAGLFLFFLPVFIFTYSRSGYACLLIVYVALCLSAKRYRLLLLSSLAAFVIAAPYILPGTVFTRIASTFDPSGSVQIAGMPLAESPAARIYIWKHILREWMKSPLLGFGVTAGGFLDSQYATVLAEQGALGLATFIWVRWRLIKHAWRAYGYTEDARIQGLCLGFQMGLIGLLFFSFAANVFIIIRVVEPFWFLAAMVMAVPSLHESPDSKKPLFGRLSSLLR